MKTILYDQHVSLNAKMVLFSGWEMPLNYPLGILNEHQTVRKKVGIFDISHMGRIAVQGTNATAFLNYLITNHLPTQDGHAVYTIMCTTHGTCVDDVIVYRENSDSYFLIANAANREKDLEHLNKYAKDFQVKIIPTYEQEGILAVQGPLTTPLFKELFPSIASMTHMQFQLVTFQNQSFILSKTGYTGEDGFEIFAPLDLIPKLWDLFLQKGKAFGIEPIGLGARDTLRLEMGYALYGHELSEDILANETVSSWTVKMKKPDFLGKAALHEKPVRYAYGLKLVEKGIPRQDYEVYKGNVLIGHVTSGSFSPSLNCGIALILSDTSLQSGQELFVKIRTNFVKGVMTPLPFIRPLAKDAFT